MTVQGVLARLAALGDDARRKHNTRTGAPDDPFAARDVNEGEITSMNNTLAAIGIRHAEHRTRAVAIGERIGLYRDGPVSKGCTPPYVPVWIDAMVKRKG